MTLNVNIAGQKDVREATRRQFLGGLLATTAGLTCSFLPVRAWANPLLPVPHGIVVRTSENVTRGSWVWLLKSARDRGVKRLYILIKQDENNYDSAVTGRTLKSGEMFAPFDGAKVAEGYVDPAWLVELIDQAHAGGIEVYAWWPCFQDQISADLLTDFHYSGRDGEPFLDPAYDAVTMRQSDQIAAMLSRYAFDGVALDWVRYNARDNGGNGPLAGRFESLYGTPWSAEAIAEPLGRALWDDLRASHVANWVGDLISQLRPVYPAVGWTAFVLPWVYKEVAQSYRLLSASGLDSLQPMIYWHDWQETADFTATVLELPLQFLEPAAGLNPTFDVTRPESETRDALDLLPADHLTGITWYHHGSWTDADFDRLAGFAATYAAARAALYGEALPEPDRFGPGERLEPALFPADSAFWSVICLGELYRREALDPKAGIVPVLAFHRFTDGALESGATDWHASTAYVSAVFDYLSACKFNVVPAAELAAFALSDDASLLADRALVITIDDGSASISSLFEPLAQAANAPYTVSLVTGWMQADIGREIDVGEQVIDRILTFAEADALHRTGRVQFVSHTHDLHHYASGNLDGSAADPAVISRLWLADENRQETAGERILRVRQDLLTSARILEQRYGKAPRFLTWPYGVSDSFAREAAKSAGYRFFFEFGGSAFSTSNAEPTRMPRVALTLADEAVPVEFPEDPLRAQQYWLAFLRWAMHCRSIPLIEATLEQLDEAQRDHPEAVIAEAALLVLRGHSSIARRQMQALRSLYPHDSAVHAGVDDFDATYFDDL